MVVSVMSLPTPVAETFSDTVKVHSRINDNVTRRRNAVRGQTAPMVTARVDKEAGPRRASQLASASQSDWRAYRRCRQSGRRGTLPSR